LWHSAVTRWLRGSTRRNASIRLWSLFSRSPENIVWAMRKGMLTKLSIVDVGGEFHVVPVRSMIDDDTMLVG
jgi:hypothetical protein